MTGINYNYSNTCCGTLGDKCLIEITISSDFDYTGSKKFIRYVEKCMNNLLDKAHLYFVDNCLVDEDLNCDN